MNVDKIIILEGPDGAGKSTLAAKLSDRLTKIGVSNRTIASLHTNPTSVLVRAYTTQRRDELPEELIPVLQEASRHATLDVLLDEYSHPSVLILDRWALSTWIYDRTHEADLTPVMLSSQKRLEYIAPVTTYVLHADAPILEGRMKVEKDQREQDSALQNKAREAYLDAIMDPPPIFKNRPILHLDTSRPIEDCVNQIIEDYKQDIDTDVRLLDEFGRVHSAIEVDESTANVSTRSVRLEDTDGISRFVIRTDI